VPGLRRISPAIGLAATFDTPLMHEVADVISTEFRAKYYAKVHPDGGDWYRGLTCGLRTSIFSAIHGGTRQETYGEDPYLTARMGSRYVTFAGERSEISEDRGHAEALAVHSVRIDQATSMCRLESRHRGHLSAAFRATVTEGKAES